MGWSIRWTLATLIALAMMAGAGYYVFNQAVSGGEYVTTPNISGLPLTEALYRLTQAGLVIGDQIPMYSEDVAQGQVISQRPAAGKVVRRGRKILVTVSGGPNLISAPQVIGQTLEAARANLEKSFIKIGSIAYLPHTSPPNTVVAQDPPAGHAMSREASVNLLISSGPKQTVIMPALVGRPLPEVTRMLAALGIDAVPNRVDNPNVAPDVVLAQRPDPGSPVEQGQQITFDVRPSDAKSLPLSRRKVEVVYAPPPDAIGKNIRFDYIDRNGVRQTIYQGIAQGNADGSGSRQYHLPLAFFDALTVEAYIDGVKVRTYSYTGDQAPVITDGDADPNEPAAPPDAAAPLPPGALSAPMDTTIGQQEGESSHAPLEDSSLDLGE